MFIIYSKFRNEYGASVLGIDLSKNMIDIANERLSKNNLKNIEFQIKDATTQNYEAASFDVIYSSHVLFCVGDSA